ncbi:MAG: hypothetical protein HY791_01150 [Deltaproteobacteria bacterium]|nr:hypothetical protein [Deltaproteobacteria bacterium]
MALGGFKGRLSLQCRAELITAEFLDVAQMLDVVLEFGLQTIHRNEGAEIDRVNDLEKVDRVLAEVRRRSIRHEVSLIFGLPCQTLGSFSSSVQWCLERQVPVIKAFPLMLLRGTRLDQKRDRWNLRESGASMPMVVSSSSFDRREWEQMARIAEALIATEGGHPSDVVALLPLAKSLEPNLRRWSSDDLERVA